MSMYSRPKWAIEDHAKAACGNMEDATHSVAYTLTRRDILRETVGFDGSFCAYNFSLNHLNSINNEVTFSILDVINEERVKREL